MEDAKARSKDHGCRWLAIAVLPTMLLAGTSCGGGDTEDSWPAAAGASADQTDGTTRVQAALTAQTPIVGAHNSAPGADYNQCVNDGSNMLRRLNARGDLIGFQYTHAGYTGLAGSTWHAQTIVRLPYYSWDSVLLGQYFVSAFSHPPGAGVDYSSHLGVARLGFKGGIAGRPVSTNRAFNDNWNGNAADWVVTPHPDDTFIAMNGTPKFKIDDTQNHPGGLSAIGWHIAVPVQKWDSSTPLDSQPLVKIYSLWNPDAPVLTSSFLTHINPSSNVGTDALSAAIVKLFDGRFLLAVNKSTPTAGVEFYVSWGTDIEAPDLFGDYRVADAFLNTTVLPNGNAWNNINFVTDCSGQIYLLGFRGDGSIFDNTGDWIDLNAINLYGGGTYPDPAFRVTATYQGSKHMYCSDNSGTDQCDMEAAAGAYVDPRGHLVIYSLNYSNDAGATPYVYGNGNPWRLASGSYANSIRGMEFRDRHGNAGYPAGQACPTMADAWFELYENPNFNNYGDDPGQVYHVDYREKDAKNGKNMGTNYFNDKASSIRYCIPVGSSVYFYRDAWSGSYQYLNGDGGIRFLPNLTAITYSYGGGSMNDSITSYGFYPGHTDPYGNIAIYDPGN